MTAVDPYIRLHPQLKDTTAIPKYPYANYEILNWDEYAIKGIMVIASSAYNSIEMVHLNKDEIKKRLAIQLAEEMLTKGCIEYTQGFDPLNQSTMIRARTFVVPSADVQLLRTMKK